MGKELLVQSDRTFSVAHPALLFGGTGGSYTGVRRSEREADHSTLSRSSVKNVWSYISTPLRIFMV